MPVYIWDLGGGNNFYGFPWSTDGVKVAFHSVSNTSNSCDPESIDRTVSEEEVTSIRSVLRDRIPSLSDGSFRDSNTCMYTITKDDNL